MNAFRQHIPAFVDADWPAPIPFETTAMSKNTLMAISDEGYHWWVVGFIEKPAAIDLPQWDGGKYLARLADGREVTLARGTTPHVVSSCGGVLTLSDGTKATDVLLERRMAKQAADRELEARGVCATCNGPFDRTETPDTNGKMRVEQTCGTCGRRIISWRDGR